MRIVLEGTTYSNLIIKPFPQLKLDGGQLCAMYLVLLNPTV